jgi:hypothetical protein
MSLEIIGAGFGRTGTLSLKQALEQLGLGPCYHMLEVQQSPERAGPWIDALDGKAVDWDGIFTGYRATVDWPACYWWRELSEHYPDAKVLLSLREAGGWYKSVENTIYKVMKNAPNDPSPEFARTGITMARRIVIESSFKGRFEDREFAIDVFNRHNQAVRDGIDPSRLLVYEPGDGWEPLCEFFEVDVPKVDFPHANNTQSFHETFGNAAMRRDERSQGTEQGEAE